MSRQPRGTATRAMAILLVMSSALLAAPTAAISVSGNVTMLNATDHSGISIVFTAASPTAVTDSTVSGATGNYAINLAVGVYDVVFRAAGYIAVNQPGQLIAAPQVLGTVVLLPAARNLNGPISGTLLAGQEYFILGNVSVAAGDTLDIQPGVLVKFMGNYTLAVNGLLRATGAVNDTIRFTSGLTNQNPRDWSGISFNSASDPNSRLDYCRIQYADWAVQVTLNSTTVSHCLITDARHGVYLFPSSGAIPAVFPTIDNCVIERMVNEGIVIGGGEFSTTVSNCSIRHCGTGIEWFGGAGSFPPSSVSNCVVEYSGMYGIHCAAGVIGIITNTRVSFANSIGIYVAAGCSPIIDHCVANHNPGTGIYLNNASPVIRNSTIFESSSGIGFGAPGNSAAQITSNIIDAFFPLGSSPSRAAGSQFTYNCLVSSVSGYYPPNVGNLVMTNANGDSCDIFLNLTLPHQMVDPLVGDFHLAATSPCIDAGDPALPTDPDFTVTDMGAFYYAQMPSGTPDLPTMADLLLDQNHPNPFNPATIIEFAQKNTSSVSLDVLDLAGRRVRSLITNQVQTAGRHVVRWDGQDDTGRAVASGVYFYRLQTAAGSLTRTMTLVR